MASESENRAPDAAGFVDDRADNARKNLELIERRIAPFVRGRKADDGSEGVEWSSGDDTITGFRIIAEEGKPD